MGLDVQVNKAITGDNAFAHSSGIHQDGLLKSRDAYEIISPSDIGLDDMELVLTARSGRHAVKHALEKLGLLNEDEQSFEELFTQFLELADRKKEVYNHDLYVLVENYNQNNGHQNKQSISENFYVLDEFQVIINSTLPT